MRATPTLGLAAIGLALAAPALAGPRLPDTFLARVEALATMETLSANILASHSATSALETWCGDHAIALPAKIRAERVEEAPEKPIRPEQRAHLKVGPDEPIRYRRVRLVCGTHVLSEADNWYVPGRLTPDMNHVLDSSDTPFGKAVAALHFTRESLGAQVVWPVLPPNWQRRPPPIEHADEMLDIPLELFEHQAVLFDDRHRPISEVDEHYMRDILPFDPEVSEQPVFCSSRLRGRDHRTSIYRASVRLVAGVTPADRCWHDETPRRNPRTSHRRRGRIGISRCCAARIGRRRGAGR